jgi:hypothetical protein
VTGDWKAGERIRLKGKVTATCWKLFLLLTFIFELSPPVYAALSTQHAALFFLSDAASFVAGAMTVLERTKSGWYAQRPAKS